MDFKNLNAGASGYIGVFVDSGYGRTVYVKVGGDGTHIGIEDAESLRDALSGAIAEAKTHEADAPAPDLSNIPF